MQRIFFIVVGLLLTGLSVILYFDATKIDPVCITHKKNGYSALKDLSSFTSSRTGIMSSKPLHIEAFQCLVQDEDGVALLNDLRQYSTKATQLYAMIGLKKLAPDIYEKNKKHYIRDKTEIQSIEGCIINSESISMIFINIDRGAWSNFYED